MAQKNKTFVLVLALLFTIGFTIGLVSAGVWLFTQDSSFNFSKSGNSTSSNVRRLSGSNSSRPRSTRSSIDLSSVPLTSTRGVDYSALRYALQERNWKQANEDTTEALLKAFGPNSNMTGYIDPQEAANPPCQDIKTVDQLWFKASDGNLGFTSQRQILKQAGGYRQGYDKLQWRRAEGEWLIQYSYDGQRARFKPGYEPNYGNPGKGHLPTLERGYNFKYSFDGTLAKCGL